jgi:hypothetical protein
VIVEWGELILVTMLGGHEAKDLGALEEEAARLVGSTREEACVGGLTKPRAAGNELREFCGARMVEEDDQFMGSGVQKCLQGKPGEQFAVLLEELFEVGNYIRFLQSCCPQAEFHHAFNLAEDVVLPEHGVKGSSGRTGRIVALVFLFPESFPFGQPFFRIHFLFDVLVSFRGGFGTRI